MGLLHISACKTTQDRSDSENKAIIGTDDRVPIQDPTIRQIVGYFGVQGTPLCTGYFSGKTEITTALHCLKNSEIADLSAFTTASGRSYKLINKKTQSEKADTVVISTEEANSNFLDSKPYIKNVPAVLYSFDSRSHQFFQSSSEVGLESGQNGFYFHTFDTLGGASGSPIVQEGNVVAIHLGWLGIKVDDKPKANGLDDLDNVNIRNFALNIADATADIGQFSALLNLECKWDYRKDCCRKVFGRRVCEPICKTTCETHNAGCDAVDAVDAFEGLKDDILNQLTVTAVASVGPKAERDGWTKANCAALGTGAIASAVVPTYAAICAAVGLSTSGTGLAPCTAWITGTTSVVVGLTCTSLCNDRKLRDCQ